MSFLAIDIGNTNITTGYFLCSELAETSKIPTASDPSGFWSSVDHWLGEDRFRLVEAVGISSVVKNLETTIADALATHRQASRGRTPRVSIVTRDSAFPLNSAYQSGLLGTDRMLAAIASVHLFGKPVITVDIGSAVTIDFVDGDGVFRGGLILAGGGFRVQALATFTSLLPEISVPQSPPPLVGTNTVECLSSGIYHGMRAEIQGLVSQIQRHVRAEVPVVVTGQGRRLFEENLPQGWHMEEALVLKGIYYTCQETGDRVSSHQGPKR